MPASPLLLPAVPNGGSITYRAFVRCRRNRLHAVPRMPRAMLQQRSNAHDAPPARRVKLATPVQAIILPVVYERQSPSPESLTIGTCLEHCICTLARAKHPIQVLCHPTRWAKPYQQSFRELSR